MSGRQGRFTANVKAMCSATFASDRRQRSKTSSLKRLRKRVTRKAPLRTQHCTFKVLKSANTALYTVTDSDAYTALENKRQAFLVQVVARG